ncbi:NAD(P)/FAD-dependent oxidoreductase [Chloroflexota bacterium]
MTSECTAKKRVIVTGAGAGGMMAAGRAAEVGAYVLLLEKTERLGNKLLISGKTRCNLTNTRELDDFIAMYGTNGRFLYSVFCKFFRDELLSFLKRYRVKIKIEKDGRIFPASDDAGDVLTALSNYMANHSVEVRTSVNVSRIVVANGYVKGVETKQGLLPCTAVVLSTGGASFPGTGSTGDGYSMAQAVGHTIIKLRPSLVPLVIFDTELAKSMQGISLRQVRLTAYQCRAEEIPPYLIPESDYGRGTGHEHPPNPIIESRLGDMMMTHNGISGPVTLQTSLAVVDALEKGPVSVAIDLKPHLTEKQLHAILQQEFERHGRRSYRRILMELLSQKMVSPFLTVSGIPPEKPACQLSTSERKRLVNLLKSFRLNIKKTLPLSAAMVTAGGISLKEIEPRTMASRLIKGLYFCGEVMDIDADTGGYNITAAFATGYVAGEHAAAFCSDKTN